MQRRLQSLSIAVILGLGLTLAFLWVLGPDLTPMIQAREGPGEKQLVPPHHIPYLQISPPFDITIVNGSALTNISAGPNFVATGPDAVLGVDEIVAALGTSDVTIDTGIGAGTAQSGTITVTSAAVLDYDGIGAFRSLTLSATHDIIVQGSITDTVCCDELLDVILSSDQEASNEGAIEVTGEIGTNGGEIVMSGGGGNLTALKTTGFARGSVSNMDGVLLDGATINAAGGDITIRSEGGSGDLADGIELSASSVVKTSLAGTINLIGRSNTTGMFSYGVAMYSNSAITSADGDILIDGAALDLGFINIGIGIDLDSNIIEATGNGNITLLGSSPIYIGVNANHLKSNSGDIVITGTSTADRGVRIRSTTESTGGGNISISGSGGTGGADNYGFILDLGGAVLANGAGTIDITGTGGAGTDNNYGIYITDTNSIIQAVSGAITLNGTSNGTGNNNYGVYMVGGTAIDVTTNGSIDVTGTGSNGAEGIRLDGANINPSTSASPITLTADSMSFAVGAQITGLGTLRLQPLTPTAAFDLTDVDLGALGNGFSQVTIGRDDSSGLISLTGGSIWTTDAALLIQSPLGAGAIDITAMALDGTDNDPITLNASNYIATTDVTNYGGAITMTSSLGQVTTGDVFSGSDSNGGPITIDAATSITAGSIIADGGGGTGGDVTLQATNDVEVAWIATDNSTGGDVTITGNFVRITGSSGCTIGTCSINTASFLTPAQGGTITINHQGNGITPFSVGDATTNGTADNLYTGAATIAPLQSFPFTYVEPGAPDIFIITGGPLATFDDDNIANGNCTLREAIIAANTNMTVDLCPAGNPGLDTITLITGTYALTRTGSDEDATDTGDLDITEDLIIIGQGAANTIIDANALSDRVFHILAGTVNFSDVTIVNGNASGNIGGGILAASNNSITLDSVDVLNNTADDGGGGVWAGGPVTLVGGRFENNQTTTLSGFGGGLWANSTLTLTDTEFNGNISGNSGAGAIVFGTVNLNGGVFQNNSTTFGGATGLYAFGALILTDTQFLSNTATDGGAGGLWVQNGPATLNGGLFQNNRSLTYVGGAIQADGDITMTNTIIISNSAASSGGGVYGSSNTTMTGVQILNNSASIGGGIYNEDGTLTLSGSTVSANMANSAAGGIQNVFGTVNVTNDSFIGNNIALEGGGGIVNDGGTFTMDGSTLDNNVVPGGDAGGISVSDGAVTLTNSTISNNSAGSNGGGMLVMNSGSTATVSNSTFSGNSANDGGGIFIDSSASITMTHTTISSNTAASAGGGISNAGTTLIGASIVANSTSGGDCSNVGSLLSMGYNLVGDNTCGTDFVGFGDITNIDPQLGPLALNAPGNTETHAILNIGSPAVDGVGPICPPPDTDQRGVMRPVGPGCDIGAYESPFISPLEAELDVVKTASPDPAVLGGKITYVITVTNNGPWPATNLTIVDDLPNPLTGLSTESQAVTIENLTIEYDPPLPEGQLVANVVNCNQVGDILTCIEDSRPANTSVILTLQITPQAPGNFINMVQVSADEPDNIPSNNSDMTTTDVIEATADLTISKSVTPALVLVGEPMTYTLDINNNGPDPAFSITIIDDLPDGLIIGPVSHSAGVDNCNTAGGTVSCSVDTLNNGESAQITIPVTPTNFYTVSTTITNTASIAAAIATDPITSNNTASESVNITPVTADLQLSKDVSTGTILLGETLVYTLSVTNLGPDPATSVVLTDSLPTNLQFVSATPDQGSCTGPTTIICNLGMVNIGTIEVVLEVIPISAGTVMNTAQVGSFAVDTNTADNSATSPPTVLNEPHPNLTLSKTASSGEVSVGSVLSYTLNVTNAVGVDPANITVVTDQLPDGAVFDSASPGCAEAGGIVTCNLGNIAPGETASPIIISIRPLSVGDITNTATVTSLGTDSNPADNTDTATTSVVPLSTVIDPATGGTLTYTDSQGNTTVINIPGGAVTTAIRLEFKPVTLSTSPPAGFVLAGEHSFTIEAFTHPGGEPLPDFAFTSPFIEVTINYSDSDVANIDNEVNLILYYLNGGAWEDAATTCDSPSTLPDPSNNQIVVTVCHLTEFGLFGPAATSPTYLPLILKN